MGCGGAMCEHDMRRTLCCVLCCCYCQNYLSPGGILTEPCDSNGCDLDQHMFKGIFMRHLAYMAAQDTPIVGNAGGVCGSCACARYRAHCCARSHHVVVPACVTALYSATLCVCGPTPFAFDFPTPAAYIATNLASMLAVSSCGDGFYGVSWTTPCQNTSTAATSSALDLMVAALTTKASPTPR